MKLLLTITATVLLFGLLVSAANAQIPNVQIFFDPYFGKTALPQCPDAPFGTVLDSMYVVASNFNMWMNAIEYKFTHCPAIIFISDNVPNGALNIGVSETGIASAWPLPQNAFSPLLVNKIKFIYNCTNCQKHDITMTIDPNPDSGFLRAIRWPDNVEVQAVGMTSLICPTVPVEETSWGQIKALYNK